MTIEGQETRQILETAHDAYVSIDGEGLIIDWNPQAEATFGWSREEAVGRELAETIIPTGLRNAHRGGLERFRRTGKGSVLGKRLEMTALHRDGHEFPVEFTISALPSGDHHTFHAFLRDVTERKEAQDDLRLSEERFRMLVDNVADYAIFMLDPDGRVSSWNRGAERMKGYALDEIIGHSFAEFYSDHDVKAGTPAAHLAMATKHGRAEYEGWRVRKDGTRFWANVTLTAMRTQDGSLRGFSKITRDMTAQRTAERYVNAQHEATRVLATSATVEEAMPGLLEAIGSATDWRVGGFWIPDGEGADAELVCAAFWHGLEKAPREFEAATMETRLTRGEGLPGRAWASAKPSWIEDVTRDENFPRAPAAMSEGLHAGISLPVLSGTEVIAVVEFLSEEIRRPDPALLDMFDTLSHQIGQFLRRKLAETEADRLKGEFFALVSHELRTPLTSIIGYLEILLEDEADQLPVERRHELMRVIDRNSRRLLRLVGDLLFVAEVEGGEVELEHLSFDLAEVARESVETFGARAEREGLDLRSEIDEVGDCAGDRGRIGQAIDNLISNSIKFTPPGGSVTVRLRSDEVRHATIEVADTGIGIPQSEQGILFERFYRASAAKMRSIEGTGLGLAIVEAIVDGHGGKVTFDSVEGEGTTFRISLPMDGREPGAGPDK